jgi:NAD(P)-dependent dehydrogenase (short-subunit alcohol dehydrogenase family)
MRVVVVGASSGLGRSIAVGLGQRGAKVALLARRYERLVDAAKEAGSGSLAIACDATDLSSCREALDEAARSLRGIDALLYAPAVGSLGRLVDLEADDWRRTFETNVIGASLITTAAIPHLERSKGVAAYLSSVNGSITPPWPGLGAYAASKAALESVVEAWRIEHPTVGFTRVIVGDCVGGQGDSTTEFANGWDHELAAELYPQWIERKLLSGSPMEVEELIRVVDLVLRCGAGANVPMVAVTPRVPQ